jgi:hypothetical protein
MRLTVAVSTALERRSPLLPGARSPQDELRARCEVVGLEVRAHVQAPVLEEAKAADG